MYKGGRPADGGGHSGPPLLGGPEIPVRAIAPWFPRKGDSAWGQEAKLARTHYKGQTYATPTKLPTPHLRNYPRHTYEITHARRCIASCRAS
jgi:hypothetical protein